VGLLRGGSDVFGADDDISQGHEWGPRFTVLLTVEDFLEAGPELEVTLREKLPTEFLGFTREGWVAFPCGRWVYSIPQYIAWRTGGYSRPPRDAHAWQRIPEHDLFTLTMGKLFYDPLGAATQALDAFAYYPAEVWHKRLIESCIRLSSVENITRCMRRGDEVAAQLYIGHTLEESLKLCHLINKRYAPYRKWLYWSFTRLPKLASEMRPFVERSTLAVSLSERRDAMLEIVEIIKRQLKAEGIVPSDHKGELFSFAHTIYQHFRGGLKQCFNGHIHDAWGSCDCSECDLI
jgi:hypothetical protein